MERLPGCTGGCRVGSPATFAAGWGDFQALSFFKAEPVPMQTSVAGWWKTSDFHAIAHAFARSARESAAASLDCDLVCVAEGLGVGNDEARHAKLLT